MASAHLSLHSLLFSAKHVISQARLLCLWGAMQQLLLLQSYLGLLSPPTRCSRCAPFSFIHILLPQRQQPVIPIKPELFLIIIFRVASICIPLGFLPLGISLLSLPLSPHTLLLLLLLSLRWCRPVSSLFSPPFAHVQFIALPLLPNSFLSSFFLFFCLVSFCLPPAKSSNEV